MEQTAQLLPDFLADLEFSLDGKPLRLFPVGDRSDMLHFALEYDKWSRVGVFVNLEDEYAEVKDSHSITRYVAGETQCWTQWDDEDPPYYKAGPFAQWVRERLIDDIERMLSWHLERVTKGNSTEWNLGALADMCRDFSALTVPEEGHDNGRYMIFHMLGAVHRCRASSAISDADDGIFERFIVLKDSASHTYTKSLAENAFNIALLLLPMLPRAIRAGLERQLDYVFEQVDGEATDVPIHEINRVARLLAGQPKAVRTLAHTRLFELCRTQPQAHTAMVAFNDYPEEAALYADHGMALDCDNVSFFVAAEACYLNLDADDKVALVRQRLESLGPAAEQARADIESEAQIQAMIDRYTFLANDFRYFNPRTNPADTGPELLELESRLNDYWMGQLPEKICLSRQLVETNLIEQRRFLSSGSASYFGWLRNEGRHQEVVDEMMKMTSDKELSTLRQKANPWGFEALLNNGLGAFLDSQVEAHIGFGIELMDAIEPYTETFKYDAPYNLACVAARAGQLERALDYVAVAVETRQVSDMAQDEDLKDLWDHPRFRELMQAKAS